MLVLGIETSCDETALALVEDGRRVVGTQVASSLEAHQRYGGVVPEIASRAHLELLTRELEHLLAGCRVKPEAVDRIAVTVGPGLAGSLLVGVAAAKALGLCWRKPVVGVNHLQAHLYAARMIRSDIPLEAPSIGLIISGGHTALVRMEGIDRLNLLGQTRDDAVGEAFDKVAKLLGLSFPGGPEIERMAAQGDRKRFRFSAPRIKSGSAYDFSFSGIKTAVYYKVQEELTRKGVTLAAGDAGMPRVGGSTPGGGAQSGATRGTRMEESLSSGFIADMAASFQQAVVEEVVMKAIRACRRHRVPCLLVGGGVIANGPMRQRLKEVCADLKIDVGIPPMPLCTDNGAMVAGLGAHLRAAALSSLTAVPNLNVELN